MSEREEGNITNLDVFFLLLFDKLLIGSLLLRSSITLLLIRRLKQHLSLIGLQLSFFLLCPVALTLTRGARLILLETVFPRLFREFSSSRRDLWQRGLVEMDESGSRNKVGGGMSSGLGRPCWLGSQKGFGRLQKVRSDAFSH
jgi:hypothetical protein